MNTTTSKLATLLGTASLLTIAGAMAAHAQQVAQAQTAQALPEQVPGRVLITGSSHPWHGRCRCPRHEFKARKILRKTGALTTSDLFRTVPPSNVVPGPVAVHSRSANVERGTRVNLRQLDTGTRPAR